MNIIYPRLSKIFTSLLLIINLSAAYGQKSTAFFPPLDIQLLLSGNFGELRSDHFHSGIDIKTNGEIGHEVFAIESGYVSRIKIQPGGYGKAIYINHKNGYTSVYGHLSEFTGAIEEYVKNLQYQLESHAIDKYLTPETLQIKKRQVIALTGNTGSSSGPHLHFEIRKSQYQIPTNCLFYDFPVQDIIPPEFTTLVLYPDKNNSQINNAPQKQVITLKKEGDLFIPTQNNPIQVFGKIGFGVEVFDYLDGASNKCGIYSLELTIDGQRYFLSEMNEFSFAESRFINAHIDYALKKEQGLSVQRLHKLPYNNLSIYKAMNGNGWVYITDTLIHDVFITATDTYGNTSNLSFRIKGAGMLQQMAIPKKENLKILPYNASSGFNDRNISITFPKYCFYDNVPFTFSRTNGGENLISDIFHVHNENTPVHKAFSMKLSADSLPLHLKEQLCIVKISDQGDYTYAGGNFEKDAVVTEIREFGKYAIAVDTIKPEIIPLNIYNGKNLHDHSGIRFKITDNLSGIVNYAGYIDGIWVLFEYDPKNELLFYEFDDQILKTGKKHDLEIHLSDQKGNKTFYQTEFYF